LAAVADRREGARVKGIDPATPAFPTFGPTDRCPRCAVPVGAVHIKTCIYIGLCKARIEANKLRKPKA
jgi:hypothetical protein